jgi:hypothetical protein
MSRRLPLLICLLLIGCNNPLDPEGLGSEVRFALSTDGSFVSSEHLVFTLISGDWSKSVEGSSLVSVNDPNSWLSDYYQFPTDHPLTVLLAVTLELDTLASTELEFDVEEPYSYQLTVFAGRGDPRSFLSDTCAECIISVPIRHRPEGFAEDSIYVRWVGWKIQPGV